MRSPAHGDSAVENAPLSRARLTRSHERDICTAGILGSHEDRLLAGVRLGTQIMTWSMRVSISLLRRHQGSMSRTSVRGGLTGQGRGPRGYTGTPVAL